MIEIKNLNVCSKRNKLEKSILNNISLTIKDCSSVALIGKSGSGKSTLAKTILNIYDNNVFLKSGSVLFDNNLLKDYERGTLISLVFQNPNSYLNPLMKVGKQIEEMFTYHLKDSKEIAKKKTLDLMKKFKIDNPETIYNYYPYKLSGGTKQKICFCIALALNPKYLVLDESTSFLDKDTKEEILKILLEYKEKGLTLIYISHDLNELYKMCDTFVIIGNGEIKEITNKEDFIFKSSSKEAIEILSNYLNFYEDIPSSLNKVRRKVYEHLADK